MWFSRNASAHGSRTYRVTAFGQAIGKQVAENIDVRLPVSLHDVLEDFRYRILPTLIG
jgi:adenine C2-methylase RlmN of 23S rRNA A2503 and tRNA A37